MDCAPVESVAQIVSASGGPPQLVVTTKHGTVVVPPDFPRRESPDGRMHVCIQGIYVMCLFMPPHSRCLEAHWRSEERITDTDRAAAKCYLAQYFSFSAHAVAYGWASREACCVSHWQ